MKACVCCHTQPEHLHGGKGPCGLCACTVFDAYRPSPVKDERSQLDLFALLDDHAHQRARIFDQLALCPAGMSSAMVAVRTELPPASVRGRLSEMAAEGTVTRDVHGTYRAAAFARVPSIRGIA